MEEVINYLIRWAHYFVGITWIGMLYYFNFVQTEYFKEAEAGARVDAFVKLAPRALWWFRWGAAMTFLTGLYLVYVIHRSMSIDIVLSVVMAILMFLNVWLIIWPNQKIVIASNEQIQAGGEATPEAAAAAPKAALASRTNTLFSLPMLFLMGASNHFGHGGFSDKGLALIVGLVIIAAIELNAIFGKQGPLTTVRGVIVSSFVLTGVMWAVVELPWGVSA